jgi:hypothetical protein
MAFQRILGYCNILRKRGFFAKDFHGAEDGSSPDVLSYLDSADGRSKTSTCLDADIKWRLFGTGPDIINAFRIGEIDLAYVGPLCP